MGKKMITKQDAEFISNTLYNYYYLRQMEQQCIQESIELKKRKDEESYSIRGNSLSNSSDGCSVHYSIGGEMDNIIKKQIEAERKATWYKESYMMLDRQYKLNENLAKITTESRIMIYDHLQKEMTIADIAKMEGVSNEAIRKKVNKAIEEMGVILK